MDRSGGRRRSADMRTKAILFDIDGTLVDSNELHITAWREAFRRYGYDFDRQTIHAQIGKGGDNLVPSLVPDAGSQVQAKIDDAHGDIFKGGLIAQVKPFPGATELLAKTKESGRAVVLASSATRDELDHHLEMLEAGDLVSETTSKDDVDRSKPAPDIFSAALKKLEGIAPEEALVIGDTPYDMHAARRCGIPAVGVRSGGFSDEQLQQAGASAVFENVQEICERFDELFASELQAAG